MPETKKLQVLLCHALAGKPKAGKQKMPVFLLFGLMLAMMGCSTQGVEPTAIPRTHTQTVAVIANTEIPPTATQTPTPTPAKKTYADMTLCFLQLSAESDWRTANTDSMKETAQKLGVKLIFSDSQGKQKNQIASMHSCIQQGVDVIALPPVVEDGWDAVLTEARNANIPVIIVDRTVSADPSLYAAHIGSDMELEGKRAGIEMNKLLPNGGNIFELSGMIDADIGRARGFRETLNKNISIMDSANGDFYYRGDDKPDMKALLKKYAGKIQGVFFHNDGMAIDAVKGIKAAGLKPGDLKMVSIDGSRAGFQLMVDGWLQAEVECNPMFGPQVMEMALKLMNGEPVDREVLTNETVYYPANAAELLPTRRY
jgi:ABC-type sugar transport system substrate-binding protein